MGDPDIVGEVPTLVLAEVFGPTLQGEGPSLGKRAGFVRLGGCNLHCTWCDTPYTWDATRYDLRAELVRRPVWEVVEQVAKMEPQVCVITGGEPLLWQGKVGWAALTIGLAEVAPVEVETNGTVAPDPGFPVTRFVVSPKLAHAGDPKDARINLPALRSFAQLAKVGGAVLKVVVRTREDIYAAAALAALARFPAGTAYVMPEGTTPTELVARHHDLADMAIQEGLCMTTRLHVLSWGTERGR